MPQITKEKLEKLYEKYNRREYVSPDPLQFLYDYPDNRDREIVGLIASSFAYGNVTQILNTLGIIFCRMGPSPHTFLLKTPEKILKEIFSAFKHRWHTAEDLCLLLKKIGHVLEEHGSLQACFLAGYRHEQKSVLPALSFFVRKLIGGGGFRKNLLPLPESGSACKRLHMFLRWMVRRDEVDPGFWDGIPASKLIVPLDTHMYRMSRRFHLTRRKQADGKAALDVTRKFASFNPEDPVKYDFVLTRFGIRKWDVKI